MALKEIDWGGGVVDSPGLGSGPVAGCGECSDEPSGFWCHGVSFSYVPTSNDSALLGIISCTIDQMSVLQLQC
jgi:hypothetical protein